MKDRTLIEMIKTDPERGIAAAVEEYGGKVKAVCRSVLRYCGQEDMEEAVSDTFVKLWKYADRFDEKKNASLKTYITMLARSVSLDRLRKQAKEIPMDMNDYDVADLSVDLESDLAKKHNEQLVRQAVSEMEEPDRSVFVLRHFYFLSIKEIAEKLCLAPKKVENILHRRKAALRRVLTERGVLHDKAI
ncbi:sigma-70 family RNA polymerase sigma factor [Eubacteriales bacterium DFI.9.88]|nr:sigma-70 family RNA polymerase sigma factor [Eubacteriales bacterium DFI.9.88]